MGPQSYMRFVVDQNGVMRHLPVSLLAATNFLHHTKNFTQQSQYTTKQTAFNSGVTFLKRVFHLG